ncbi:MAG: hypothetical protein H7Y59_01595 [Anaerolineales bacterium]|nr:hypothetical protein [Anaerolineales bacterium]
MNKLNSQTASLTLSTASYSELKPARRLIVLVPYLEVDPIPAARRVWELANEMDSCVHFIGLHNDAEQELTLRRELVTMSAMVNDRKVSSDIEVIFGKDWAEAVKSRWQAGDIVVCFSEQRVGLLRKPLSEVLQSELNIPLYILSGLYPKNSPRPNWPAQIAAWTGSVVIILGFFLLQVKVDHLAKDWSHTLLLLLSIPIEVSMIWGWNSLFE